MNIIKSDINLVSRYIFVILSNRYIGAIVILIYFTPYNTQFKDKSK